MYGSTTKGDVVKRSDCILVYGSTTKGGVVKRSDCIPVYGSTTKGDVKRFDCTKVHTTTVCVLLLFILLCIYTVLHITMTMFVMSEFKTNTGVVLR